MLRVSFLALMTILLIGCGNNDSTSVTVNNTTDASAYIVFDSTGGDIPYPNNILFASSTDGTLNIPYNTTDSDASVKAALNALDGFSTTSPISIGFTGELNATSLQAGLKVYKASTVISSGVPIVTAIDANLTFGIDYIATTSGQKIVVLPTKPLDANQTYVIVLTNNITSTDAKSIAPDIASELLLSTTALIDGTGNHTSLSDADATTFEGIRQATQAIFARVLTNDASLTGKIVTAWSFKTQSIGSVVTAFSQNIATPTMGLVDTNLTSKQIVESATGTTTAMTGIADVYAGTLSSLPYYLAKATSTHDTAPLTKSFVFSSSSLPDVNATITIPILVTVPNNKGTMPTAGWPVVIFQHGITQNRTNVLAISEAIANAGYAAVAIDLPLHGIDDNTSGLYQATRERTFDLDLINNTTSAAGPDNKIDASGTHYINLASLLTSRDNIRQTTSDLLALKNTFGNIVATNGLKFDASKVAFVGHSLGTIASFGFLSKATLQSVTLAMPGGGIAELLNNSKSYGPIIAAGLAAKGVTKGTTAYSSFMLATQTVLDDADPLNYAASVGAKHNVFAIEVIGTDSSNTDQVIPNNATTDVGYAYLLYGTEPLVKFMGAAADLNATSTTPDLTARYIAGDHSSILDPKVSAPATTAMQTQVATFLGSIGTLIPVVDSSVLK